LMTRAFAETGKGMFLRSAFDFTNEPDVKRPYRFPGKVPWVNMLFEPRLDSCETHDCHLTAASIALA